MKQTLLLLSISGILLTACQSSTETQPIYTLLQGATLYDGNGKSITNSRVLVKEGRIESVGGDEITIPNGTEIIDLTSKFITPGLVDAHIHFSQTGFFDGRPDALDIRDTLRFDSVQARQQRNPQRYFETYLRSGVTAVYDVGGFEWSIDLQKSAENDPNAPHVAASGPLLTPFVQDRLDMFNVPPARQMLALNSEEFGIAQVQRATDMGATGIKIWSLNLADTTFMKSLSAVSKEVNSQGNQLIVHATNLDEAKQALQLGAKVLVHSVDDQPIDDEFIQLAKENDVIYCPTLVVVANYSVAYKSLKGKFPVNDPNLVIDADTRNLLEASQKLFKYFPDPDKYEEINAADDIQNDKLTSMMYANLKRVYEAGITIALSTDAGNPGTLHGLSIYDELEAMQKAGIPSKDIIPMATKNGALAMRRANDFGTVEVGKMADLIVMEKDPSVDVTNFRSITHVMRGGLLRPVNVPFEK